MTDYDKGYADGRKDQHTAVLIIFEEAERMMGAGIGRKTHTYLKNLIVEAYNALTGGGDE
jgi:hypothetical protein